MPSRTVVRLVYAGVLLVLMTVGTALAQPFDKRTYFSFSGPTAIPGVTLPAGKYLFRIMDTSSRNVVQVLSENGRTSYAMFFAFRPLRTDVPSKPEIRFMETAVGMPAAVDTWWYPGERTGYEFVYPKEQARRLAMGTGQPVLTTETPIEPYEEVPEFVWVEPSGEETKVAEAAPLEPTGEVQEGELAPPSLAIAEPALPKTGSVTTLIMLAGFALLGGAAFVRGVRLLGT